MKIVEKIPRIISLLKLYLIENKAQRILFVGSMENNS